jgi:hypothetical protein
LRKHDNDQKKRATKNNTRGQEARRSGDQETRENADRDIAEFGTFLVHMLRIAWSSGALEAAGAGAQVTGAARDLDLAAGGPAGL